MAGVLTKVYGARLYVRLIAGYDLTRVRHGALHHPVQIQREKRVHFARCSLNLQIVRTTRGDLF